MKTRLQIVEYKRLINLISGYVPLSTANTNEHSVLLEAKSGTTEEDPGKLVLTVVSSGIHKLSLELKAEVLEPGYSYMSAALLKNMTKALQTKAEFVEVALKRGQLTYCLAGLGSISESRFHNQAAFQNLNFGEAGYKVLFDDCSEALLAFQHLGRACGLPNCQLVVHKGSRILELYGQVSEACLVKYEVVLKKEALSSFSAYFKHSSFKILPHVKPQVLEYNPISQGLRFVGSGGTFLLNGNGNKTASFESINHLSQLEVAAEVTLKRADLLSAIDWQSYGCQNGDSINLSTKESKLIVHSSKAEEAAEVELIDYRGEFLSAKFSYNYLPLAIKAAALEEIVTLKLITINLKDKLVKVIMIEPWECEGVIAKAVLYEQLLLTK